MATYVFYIDESYDTQNFVMSAVGFRVDYWRAILTVTQDFRKDLRDRFGIKITREIHSSEFIRDCGDNISSRKLNLGQRKHAFELCLRHLASLAPKGVRVINVCLPVASAKDLQTLHYWVIEHLVNRIERTMKEQQHSQAFLVFDEGKERQITKLLRRMSVFNFIPSQFGAWANGAPSKNIACERIIEDPIFRPSHRSLLLQCADHAAFTLLKRESTPAPFIERWGYHRLFPILAPLRFFAASSKDPDGIVRK